MAIRSFSPAYELTPPNDEFTYLARKCRTQNEEYRKKRPRAQHVEIKDIPAKVQKLRRTDYKTPSRVRRSQRSRRSFSKQLVASRPRLSPTPSRDSDSSTSSDSESDSGIEVIDDQDESVFQRRVGELTSEFGGSSIEEDVTVDFGLRMKRDLLDRLFAYQIEGVKWMFELHKQEVGGILGDEMGLGKTIQIISFLGALHCNDLYEPSLVLCPVTLLQHWLDQVWDWYPWFRVFILHESISRKSGTHSYARIIRDATKCPNGLLVTSYEHFRLHSDELLGIKWGYVVLDEGHKIKNPDADITLLVKRVRTRRRLIMTGSPVQNRLAELWSLFDFVFPGKLGTLPVFEAEFGAPIQVGGYKNASRLSVARAQKCIAILRETIKPYILIRNKTEVDLELPQKREKVLFCALCKEQKKLYKDYLNSAEVESILRGKQDVLAGIVTLKKICNHPDLLQEDPNGVQNYGNPSLSRKLEVTLKIMQKWKEQDDKVLLFTQTQFMLDILELHMQKLGYTYHRMDGQTSVNMRNKYIKSFNSDQKIFAFLLTTRVGGLGVNLTGANRVLLYDPDWNPSIDVQARERAWRIGQNREVTVYRLITIGTIEEKIYQRQIFKQFLKDKVLSSTSQKRLFSSKTIRDLFTFNDEAQTNQTETEQLLRGPVAAKEGDEVLEAVLGIGVKTVLDQKIVESCKIDSKTDLVSYEASQAAKEALCRMQTAGEQRSKFDVHFPTWTGKHGSAGAPTSRQDAEQFGYRIIDTTSKISSGASTAPSSSTLLDMIQERKRPPDIEPYSTKSSPQTETCLLPAKPLQVPKNPPSTKQKIKVQETALTELDEISDEDLSRWRPLIIDFFKKRGCAVECNKVNAQLVQTIPPPKQKQFRSILSRLATRKRQGTGRWVLKSDL